jgi:hypothetical protein
MNVFIKRAGFLALSAPHHEIAPDKRGGLKGSTQHWLAVSFQQLHKSARWAEDSFRRLAWLMNTTFEKDF